MLLGEEANHSGNFFRSEGFDVNKSLRKLLENSFCDPHRSALVDCSDDEEDTTTAVSSPFSGLFSVSSDDLTIDAYESPRKSWSDFTLKTPESVAHAEDSSSTEECNASRNLSKSAYSEQTFFATGGVGITDIRIQEGDHTTSSSRKSSRGLIPSQSTSTEQDSSTTEHNAVKSAPVNSSTMRTIVAVSFLVLLSTGLSLLVLTNEWSYTGGFSLEGAKQQWIQQKENEKMVSASERAEERISQRTFSDIEKKENAYTAASLGKRIAQRLRGFVLRMTWLVPLLFFARVLSIGLVV